MKKLMTMIAAITLLGLTGCVTSHPQTAQEFREAVPGAFLAKVETFVVDRPFAEVARTFQDRAPECLSGRVKTTSQSSTSYQVIVTAYTPTVHVSPDLAEIHLQQHHEQGVMNITKEPDGGYYLIVADAIPIDATQTRVDMYRPSVGREAIVRAIKGWASGETTACPDLTKI